MSGYHQLFVHCVWATWDRVPMVTPALASPIYGALTAKASELGCRLIAVNGMPDHVHTLVELSPTVAVAQLVGEMKGVSSHLVNHRLVVQRPFRWQRSYAAFTVSKRAVPLVRTYIERQAEHHAAGTTHLLLEAWDEEAGAARPPGH